MERAGARLKRARDRLKLTYRDVEEASQMIAARHGNDEFAIALSRLADIENKGTVPSVFRLYSLCAIYRLEFDEVLQWYGVPRGHLAADALQIEHDHTHLVKFTPRLPAAVPAYLQAEAEFTKTTVINHLARNLGKSAAAFLDGLDLRHYRFGLIGMDDWSMYPVLQPGSLVVIDDHQRKIATGGWASELDRPIYFFETRDGYHCGWCTIQADQLIIQPHPGSQQPAISYVYPAEIELVGQVIGVAMRLDSRRRTHARTAAAPAKSQNP
jgi:transcriptional regulator with XRE-family HTH domain